MTFCTPFAVCTPPESWVDLQFGAVVLQCQNTRLAQQESNPLLTALPSRRSAAFGLVARYRPEGLHGTAHGLVPGMYIIVGRGGDVGVSQQARHRRYVDAALHRPGGKGVAQCVVLHVGQPQHLKQIAEVVAQIVRVGNPSPIAEYDVVLLKGLPAKGLHKLCAPGLQQIQQKVRQPQLAVGGVALDRGGHQGGTAAIGSIRVIVGDAPDGVLNVQAPLPAVEMLPLQRTHLPQPQPRVEPQGDAGVQRG